MATIGDVIKYLQKIAHHEFDYRQRLITEQEKHWTVENAVQMRISQVRWELAVTVSKYLQEVEKDAYKPIVEEIEKMIDGNIKEKGFWLSELSESDDDGYIEACKHNIQVIEASLNSLFMVLALIDPERLKKYKDGEQK